jgi:hypothetical protein
MSLFVLLCAYVFAGQCHFAAEKNFNERAMGYYLTQLSLVNRSKGVESKPAAPKPEIILPAGLVERKEIKLAEPVKTPL